MICRKEWLNDEHSNNARVFGLKPSPKLVAAIKRALLEFMPPHNNVDELKVDIGEVPKGCVKFIEQNKEFNKKLLEPITNEKNN